MTGMKTNLFRECFEQRNDRTTSFTGGKAWILDTTKVFITKDT